MTDIYQLMEDGLDDTGLHDLEGLPYWDAVDRIRGYVASGGTIHRHADSLEIGGIEYGFAGHLIDMVLEDIYV